MADTEFIEPQDSLIGKTIGGEFTVIQKVGSGGMGSVYLARQHVTERSVALKVLHAHLVDGMFMQRFTQEARIISRLNHPNIVTVYKYGQSEEGSLYIAMEFVDGSNLGELIVPEWYFEVPRALPLMIQMADALAYAHEKQIIHRDIKPDNMVLTRTGRTEMIKILDFGVAKMLDDVVVRTKTGALCGSPPYMAPEQWQQVRDVDGRMDIYSLGCVFYRMVTGVQPFDAETTVGYMKAHLNELPRPPAELSDSLREAPALSEVIVRCMSRDRDDRYPDAYALLEELKEIQRRVNLSREGRGGAEVDHSPPPLPSFLEPTPFAGVMESGDHAVALGETPLPGADQSDDTHSPAPDLAASPAPRAYSSSESLPAKSSGTNLALSPAPSRLETFDTPISSPPGGSPIPTIDARARAAPRATAPELERPAAATGDEDRSGGYSHIIFVVTGIVLLVFLLVSGLYFWVKDPTADPGGGPQGEETAPVGPVGWVRQVASPRAASDREGEDR